MALNKKRLYEALMQINAGAQPSAYQRPAVYTSPYAFDPSELTANIAHLMDDKALRLADNSETIAEATEASREQALRERSTFDKVMSWLDAPGATVRNTIADVTELAKGEDSVSGTLADIGKNLAAGAGTTVSPISNLLMIPGVEVPGEQALEDFQFKHNTEFHGDGRMSGTRLLEEMGALPDTSEEGIGARIAGGVAGFGTEVLLDPLTYGTLGLSALAKGAGRGAKTVEKTLDEAAAGVAKVPEEPAVRAATVEDASPEVPSVFKAPEKSAIGDNLLPYQTLTSGATPTPGATSQPKVDLSHIFPELSDAPQYIPGTRPLDNILIDQTMDPPPIDPSVRMTALSHKRWYETPHQVEYDEKPVRKLRTKAAQHSIGDEYGRRSAENLGAPRAVTRDEQVEILDEIRGENPNIPESDFKYVLRNVEEQMEAEGFTFPDGKLSHFINQRGVKNLSDDLNEFTVGKPLKEAPDPYANVPDPKPKEATPETFVRDEVAAAIDNIASGVMPGVNNFERATGPVAAAAVKAAQDAVPNIKGKKLNPAEQANLFNRVWNAARDMLESSTEAARGKKRKIPYGTTKRDKKAIRNMALSMLRNAEDHMISQGIRPEAWDGTSLRLSSVLAELGEDALDDYIPRVLDAFKTGNLDQISDPLVKQAIARSLAERRVALSNITQQVMSQVRHNNEVYKESLSPNKYRQWKEGKKKSEIDKRLVDNLEDLSPTERRMLEDVIESVVDPEDAKLYPFEEVLSKIKIKAGEKIDPKYVTAMNQAVDEIFSSHGFLSNVYKKGAQSEKKRWRDLLWDIENTTVDRILTRITTWNGRGEMFHTSRGAYDAAAENAKMRAQWLHNVSRNHTDDEIYEAFKLAQTMQYGLPTAGSPKVQQLAAQMHDYVEAIFGSSSQFAKNADAAAKNSPATLKMQAEMADIDRELKAIGSRFSFGKYVNRTDSEYAADNWRLAWEKVDPKAELDNMSPLSFLHDLDLAAERVAARYALIDDFVSWFGVKKHSQGYNPMLHIQKFNNPRVEQDIRFEPKVLKEMERLLKDIDDGPWRPSGKFSSNYFKALRAWKSAVTIYHPSHHIRNGVGDAFLTWFSGENDVRMYKWAKQVIGSERARYNEALQNPDIGVLQGLINKTEHADLNTPHGKPILKRNGANITASEIYTEAMQRGLLLSAQRLEDIVGDPLFASLKESSNPLKKRLAEPLGGRGHEVASGVSEYREHYFRIAHFTAVVNKKLSKSVGAKLRKAKSPAERKQIMDKIYADAAEQVRKWHPDGRDLTQFEQKYMRGIIPFYSWMRKSTPLLVQTLAQRPAKLTTYPRANYALQQSLGITDSDQGFADPFPYDELYPSWIRAGGIGPIGDTHGDNIIARFFGNLGRQTVDGAGNENGYTVIDPGNPFQDTLSDFFGVSGSPLDIAQGVTGMMTPAINVPAQLLTGRKMSGAPILKDDGGSGVLPFLADQIPMLSHIQRVAEVGQRPREGVEPGMDTQALYNWLTGLGIQGTGQYRKSGEFEHKEYLKKLIEEGR